jgi:5-methyltetrahydropteroyltriglutamate--homocysteine methyltransferase
MPSGSGRPPFRADHIGSLLRPAGLRQAFREHADGRISDAAFAHAQDSSIRDVVQRQADLGLGVVTDGEFRRASYWARFVERMDGLGIRPAEFHFRDEAGHERAFTAPYAEGRLRRLQPLALDEFLFLRDATPVERTLTAKITLPAPSTMHFYRCRDFADRKVYPEAQAFFSDLSQVFRDEIADLAGAGCRYVQLDEVALAMLCDPAIRAQVVAQGEKPDALVDLYVDAINQAVAGARNVVIGVHVCRGNFKGNYLAAGGYEEVAERFFNNTNVNHFLLEFDTERAGDFSPLRFVPRGKAVVLGLVSSKTPERESLDLLTRRVEQASKFIPLDRLAISPQCGFASTVAGNPVSEADQWTKLTLVVDAARKIWGEP